MYRQKVSRFGRIGLLSLLLFGVLATLSGTSGLSTNVASAQESTSNKLKLGLSDLVGRYKQGGLAAAFSLAAEAHLPLYGETVHVYLYTEGNSGVVHVQNLKDLGITELNASQLSNLISASVPIPLLESVAEFPFVLYITPPSTVVPSVATEALPKIGATEYHTNGYDGNGAKVAVIDIQYEGLTDRINEGELPSNMVTKYFFANGTVTDTLTAGDGPHGVACAEIIHDIAPQAQLYLIQAESLEVNLESIFN